MRAPNEEPFAIPTRMSARRNWSPSSSVQARSKVSRLPSNSPCPSHSPATSATNGSSDIACAPTASGAMPKETSESGTPSSSPLGHRLWPAVSAALLAPSIISSPMEDPVVSRLCCAASPHTSAPDFGPSSPPRSNACLVAIPIATLVENVRRS